MLIRFCLVLLAILITSCSRQPSEVPESTTFPVKTPTLSAASKSATLTDLTMTGIGSVTGELVGRPAGWQDRTLVVYLCPFYETSSPDEGFYVLEPTVHPSAEITSGGDFRFSEVAPGKYVMVVGPSPEESIAVMEDGRAEVLEIVAGVVLDVGRLDLR